MTPFMVAAVLRPFVLLVMFVAIVWPLKYAFVRFCPDCAIKRLLLRPIART